MATFPSFHGYLRAFTIIALSTGVACSTPAFDAHHSAYSAHSDSDTSANFDATYGSSPAPFKINVHPKFIAETVLKVSHTRYVVDIDEPDFVDGPPRHNVTAVRDYWVNHYNWFDVQDELNEEYVYSPTPIGILCDGITRYKHFTTTVTTGPKSNFTDPVPLHFVHHRSKRTDAIPLLFIHGWPGSFIEVGNILDGLTNPPDASLPAFHVVAPSIPGFGFSPAPKKPGFGPREAGDAFHSLMQQLNYTRFVVQGGDFGGIILRYLAADNPVSVVSVLDNFWATSPNATDLKRYQQGLTTKDENTTIENLNRYNTENSGYRLEQQTLPLQLAIGMTDSPIGFAMWIYTLMHSAVDRYIWTPKEIITWSMMYYIQGPYGGMRFYKESLREVRYPNIPIRIHFRSSQYLGGIIHRQRFRHRNPLCTPARRDLRISKRHLVRHRK